MFDTDGNERVDKQEFLVVNIFFLFSCTAVAKYGSLEVACEAGMAHSSFWCVKMISAWSNNAYFWICKQLGMRHSRVADRDLQAGDMSTRHFWVRFRVNIWDRVGLGAIFDTWVYGLNLWWDLRSSLFDATVWVKVGFSAMKSHVPMSHDELLFFIFWKINDPLIFQLSAFLASLTN